MSESNYLKLARDARKEGNSEDAKRYYNLVREEDPQNCEAKYFYAYYSVYAGKNGELSKNFSNLCTVVLSTIKLLNESSLSTEEKLFVAQQIVESFCPETWSLNSYMNRKNRETKVGDSYVRVFDSTVITTCIKNGMKTLKALGDSVDSLFGNDPSGKKIAAIAWKEYVSLSQKWYAHAVKGDAELYTEKIKSVDPAYEMPKKAGCITLG